MRICGACGTEFRCCKTGMVLHDTNFHPKSRHAADLFYCESCHSLFINRNDAEYFVEAASTPVHCTITNDSVTPIIWEPAFVASIRKQYNLTLA